MNVNCYILIWSLLLKLFLKKNIVVKLEFDISKELLTKTIKQLYFYKLKPILYLNFFYTSKINYV